MQSSRRGSFQRTFGVEVNGKIWYEKRVDEERRGKKPREEKRRERKKIELKRVVPAAFGLPATIQSFHEILRSNGRYLSTATTGRGGCDWSRRSWSAGDVSSTIPRAQPPVAAAVKWLGHHHRLLAGSRQSTSFFFPCQRWGGGGGGELLAANWNNWQAEKAIHCRRWQPVTGKRKRGSSHHS